MKKRIEWIDTAKWMCMMFVMLEHLESGCDELSVLYTTCYVEMFFVAAGYVHRPGQSAKDFFIKKVKCLIVPWLVFSFLDITIAQIVSFGEHESYLFELLWNLVQIRQYHAMLWFIPALFAAFVPFYFFIEWYERRQTKGREWLFLTIALALYGLDVAYSHLTENLLFPWGSSRLPWHLDYVFIAMYYMVLGYLLRRSFEGVFDRLNTRLNRIILLAVYLVCIYYPYVTSLRLPNALQELMARITNPLMGCILVCAYSKIIKSNRYFSYVGQNTILYFAFHGKIMGFAQGIFKRFFGGIYTQILANKLTSSAFAICFTVILSFVLIIPVYLVNRYMPFLVGRSHKKSV